MKAHGIAGAAARATPVLGDLISAHDLGSELARDIKSRANAEADANLKAINEPVDAAFDKANEQTIAAYQELAPQIQVTKDAYEGQSIVNPHEVAAALRDYRDEMGTWNRLRGEGSAHIKFDEAAKASKRRLKQRLIQASQSGQPQSPDSRT